MNKLVLLILMLVQALTGLGLPVVPATASDFAMRQQQLTTVDDNGDLLHTASNSDGLGAMPAVPTSGARCSTGCSIGIGVGCLVAVTLSSFIFIMARRHKRKMNNTQMHNKWLAKQKALPDKPVPVPPTPTKF
ncbi:hypothetical protein GGF42_002477 [Coemansia sp. RSA 2424]|nr:hypothetical protein GGF42_002477 [Coemansia sp. RSA 2424]